MSTKNPLQEALNAGDFNQAKELLKKGDRLPGDLAGYHVSTIFDTIIRKEEYGIVQLFLQDGTIQRDIYEYDSFGGSIFESIIRCLPEHETALAFLTTFLTGIQNINSELQDQTLLGFALEEGAAITIVRCITDAGGNLHYKNNAEQNLIHAVVRNNRLAMRNQHRALEYLQFLIHAGVDVHAADIVQQTPLILAIKNDKAAYLTILLENGANPHDQDKEGNTAFYYAVVHKLDYAIYDTLTKFSTPPFDLLNKEGEAILPAFMRMVHSGSASELQLLERLIDDGADLTQTSPYYNDAKSSLDWIAEKKAVVLELIIKKGKADLHYRDDEGNTLLHKVCAFNVNFEQQAAKETYRKVKLLLDHGADANALNDADETPFMIASLDNLKSKTAELLLAKKLH
jgi:uncharacterized protein